MPKVNLLLGLLILPSFLIYFRRFLFGIDILQAPEGVITTMTEVISMVREKGIGMLTQS